MSTGAPMLARTPLLSTQCHLTLLHFKVMYWPPNQADPSSQSTALLSFLVFIKSENFLMSTPSRTEMHYGTMNVDPAMEPGVPGLFLLYQLSVPGSFLRSFFLLRWIKSWLLLKFPVPKTSSQVRIFKIGVQAVIF